jgi:hypothetical protein
MKIKTENKKMIFHSNQLGLRGTEIALYDYAYYSREYLNIHPIIVSDKNNNLDAYEKFKNEFDIYLYDNFNEVQYLVDNNNIEYSYFIKAGNFDNKLLLNTKNIVHSVFQIRQEHGDVYAYISKWLSLKMSNGILPNVPFIVNINMFKHNMNYRELLNIPQDSIVYGYYGGNDSFNIQFVKDTVVNYAIKNKNVYFIFMNINKFTHIDYNNILFFDGTFDMSKKVAFINSCDACIHGRNGGESFGLTIAEFSSLNKPIITFSGNETDDNAHLDMLGNKAILYSNETNLIDIFDNFSQIKNKYENWNCYEMFNSFNVITNDFNNVFLDNIK